MDGRVLGSVVLLIRTFAAGVEFLQSRSIPSHPGRDEFFYQRQNEILIALGFWFAITMGYHVLTFGLRGSWLSTWMSSPMGGGGFALATLILAVPSAFHMFLLTFRYGSSPITSNLMGWLPSLAVAVVCAIWLSSAIRETPKESPQYE